MPRKKKDSTIINLALDSKVVDRFKKYADEKGQSYTVCLERLITTYLDAEGFEISN